MSYPAQAMVERIWFRSPVTAPATTLLSWGQREILREMRFTGVPLNMGGVRELPPGTTV